MAIVKVILLCGGRLALPTLKELAFNQTLAVVVIPSHCDEMLEEVNLGLAGSGIPVIEVNKQDFEVEIIKAVTLHQANLGVMVTFSFLLPISVFGLPKYGFYNVHPGPLPAYRGSDPIFQQIRKKEKFAGATLHFVDERFDTGPMFLNEMIRLEATDTYGSLTTKLAAVCAKLIMSLIKIIGFDIAINLKQQDKTKARYYKKQVAKDITINWNTMMSSDIVALINACNPWNKGATSSLDGKIIRLLEAQIISGHPMALTVPPGTVLGFVENNMLVSSQDKKALLVSMVYIDEGFLHASVLQKLGVTPGLQFQNIIDQNQFKHKVHP